MRILLIMDPGISVPPPLYGGHERLVYMFAEEYIKMGHSVTLLAGPNSYCSGKTVSFGINDLSRGKLQIQKELLDVWNFLRRNRNEFDLVHNFGRLLYLLPVLNYPVKKIMTYGREVSKQGIKVITSLPNKNIVFTACSNDCVATGNVAGRWETVYNAIEFNKYTLAKEVDPAAPLMFLGRLDKIKGAHTAIKIAKETKSSLWIAGNVPNTPDNLNFYKQNIEPFFDNKQIIYLGPLNDKQKDYYLGKSKALLFPIEWSEPFGMVMIEAMACGTPVIAFQRGSVPEVIDQGITGLIVNTEREMQKAVEGIRSINRERCRNHSLGRFNVTIIAQHYLNLFNA